MTRCRHFTATIAALGLLLAVLPASGQQQPLATTGAAVRNFPANALRGSVTFVSGNKLLLNGNAVRSAPGLRVFDARNRLVMPGTLRGNTYTVHYVMEASTQMLHTVWLITETEAAKPRAAPGMVVRNFKFESELPEPRQQR